MKKSNRYLCQRFILLNRISFCNLKEKRIQILSCLKSIYYDVHDLCPFHENYVFRAIINKTSTPYDSITRISYNPEPKYISRANLIGQGIGYYACAPDISIIEACQEQLKSTNIRNFDLTVSKWKIKKTIPVQIICHSKQAQSKGTDLMEFYRATKNKRKKDLPAGKYRTWCLKMQFIANQYAKTEILCNKDYYISAWHSKNILNHPEIDGIIYPSVPYIYKGFNYAFSVAVFKNSNLELEEVSQYSAQFNKNNIREYPYIELIKSTKKYITDKIIW